MDETIDHLAHYPGRSYTSARDPLGCQPYYHVTADLRRSSPRCLCHRSHDRTLPARHATPYRYSCCLSRPSDSPWLNSLSDYQYYDNSTFRTGTKCEYIADTNQ